MKLQAVFWDYPEFLDEVYLRAFLQRNKQQQIYYWIMRRFLEHGRVVDALSFFSLKEIASHLQELGLSQYNQRKWQRLLEVYDSA